MSVETYCDELDGLLAAVDGDAPGLDELHGFISAALCGPRVMTLDECVSTAFLPEGGDDETIECELPARLVELIGELYEDTRRSIADGSFLPLVPCTQEQGPDEADARQWCCGFLMCMEHSRARWKLDSDRVLELVTPIVLLADEQEFERALAHVQEIGPDDFRLELLDELPASVCGLRKLFGKEAAGTRPQRKKNVKNTRR